jgi:hypothetical protein
VGLVGQVGRVTCVGALTLALLLLTSGVAATPADHIFLSRLPAEAVARILVRCDQCSWSTTGREAVTVSVVLDDRAPLHLPIVRSGLAEYSVLLGRVEPGQHTVRIDEVADLTATELRGRKAATIEHMTVEQIATVANTVDASLPIALAPIVYARPNTVGRFTDVPVLMWYEVEPTTRGTRYRYTVIFTNEDGGTTTDRLMATWGRTTDIEYLYSVEVDRAGAILAEDMQGPKHEILPFAGRREGRHPLLWVSTDNNMVLDTGTVQVRYALVPVRANLTNLAREVVMDQHAWLYQLMSEELAREGKIVPDSPPGKDTIPDPRTFLYLEGCGEVGENALAFAARVGDRWIESDRQVPEYRIVRDGCFRAAVPLPSGTTAGDVRAVRVQAHPRPAKNSKGLVTFRRLNYMFMLDASYKPGSTLLEWTGSAALTPGGTPLELRVP